MTLIKYVYDPGPWVVFDFCDTWQILSIHAEEIDALRAAVGHSYSGVRVGQMPWGTEAREWMRDQDQ